ncbi:hypothetical protein [Candidatus Uabimicrobium amorphum]|uniref:Uncharacterized protein n=1 Tax=Uabimicrobium amorphum TaxID=2596890 RepID=A0A5S9IIV8_UABAM|nr:hypothetical protein [Candidatus Uabimicrobium amorphum]BBM82699.1 hypothetical protein UABAM_01042 [Candidatus Uabimicrobium amorphum]
MTVEKWIQLITGFISGIMLACIFLAIQGVFFYLTNTFMSSDYLVIRILSWLLDICNGLLYLLVFFVVFHSLRKNKKLAVVVANVVLLGTSLLYLSWWIFY